MPLRFITTSRPVKFEHSVLQCAVIDALIYGFCVGGVFGYVLKMLSI